ncbi:MAG TPA: nucleotide exchange factor GrpE [Bryobacteraceae bacterium]|jgi:molecular chaperone GrpE|nr:nucleotide exchange factor GrpE [Bryobacteraceae bacterium]
MTAGLDRDEILRRFEALLDSALASEAPPSGIDAEILSSVMTGSKNSADTAADPTDRRCDAFALWAAMTALTQETKLQGRAFQELNRAFAAQMEKVADELRAAYAERDRTMQRDTERRCRREALSALIDLRDRLGRGRESVRASEVEIGAASRAGWWDRVFGKRVTNPGADAVGALIRGYELGIERLDQTLDEFNAREIRCQGESFDPRRMNAIESEESAAVPGGTVLEVYRSGYEWNGEVFRPAQVKVSREPAIKK